MRLEEIKEAYQESSGQVSSLSRQLAFAGIAVIWVLRVGDSVGGLPYGANLIVPLAFFAGSLALDFLQYLYKTVAWGLLNWINWKKHGDNRVDIVVPSKINWLTDIFFWGKVSFLVIGFYLLLAHLYSYL